MTAVRPTELPLPETMRAFEKTLFAIRVSVKYHRARQRFFDAWARVLTFVSLFSGTSAFVALIANVSEQIALYSAGIVALAQLIEIIISPSQSARAHSELARRFILLEREALTSEFELTDKAVMKLASEKLAIEGDEPPVKKWLSVTLVNELERSEHGRKAKPYIIPLLQRPFIQLFDLFDVSKAMREDS